MIRFIEIVRSAPREFSLREVWINENFVVKIEESMQYRELLKEGKLPLELDTNHRFSTVTISEGGASASHIVVGDVRVVASKLSRRDSSQTLLKG
jgi:hypothetical protein